MQYKRHVKWMIPGILTFSMYTSASNAGAPGAGGDLYVSSQDLGAVLQYDGVTGDYVGVFASGLDTPSGLVFRDNGNLLVVSGNAIIEFDNNGGFLGMLTSISEGQRDLEWGPDGALYVASGSFGVQRYDAQTGAFLGAFTSGVPLPAAWGIAFGGPNQNLYVTDSDLDQVLEFDGVTGVFVGVVGGTGGLLSSGCEFGPNGNLFVSAVIGNVVEYDVSTNVPVSVYPSGSAVDLTFHPVSNNLLVPEFTNLSNIVEHDTNIVQSLGPFATGAGHPRGAAFKPVPGLTGDMNCDGLIDGADVGPFVIAILDPDLYEAQYSGCQIENGDVNDDSQTDPGDIALFVSLLLAP